MRFVMSTFVRASCSFCHVAEANDVIQQPLLCISPTSHSVPHFFNFSVEAATCQSLSGGQRERE